MSRANADHQHFLKLRDYFAKENALPSSLGRLAEAVGFSSANAALKLRDRLCTAGILRKDPGGKVVPTEHFFTLPMMGANVRAGTPDAPEPQSWADLMSLEGFLVRHPSKTVLLKVRGDSMRDAGILDGDLAIVELTKEARSGEIVVAVVDGDYTLKELRYEGKRPVLVPHNPNYAPIRPQADLEIYGVFRGLARSLWPANARGEKTL